MTDSPAVHAPLDPKEAPILERVLFLRDKLSLLKQDKSTYIKSHDVINLYDEVIEQVHLLNIIRQEHGKPLEQNRGWLIEWDSGLDARMFKLLLILLTQSIMFWMIASSLSPYSF